MLTTTSLPNGKKTGYGIGWGLGVDKSGRKIISHTGGNAGSVCRLIVYPESELTIALVSNTSGIDYLKFMRTVNQIPNIFLED
jgi:CubicO group peptidase (beta-lactamase class C family)